MGWRGSVIFFFLLFLVPLLGAGALAIDYGYILLVRAQLQNAADASANVGAAALYPYSSTGPAWSAAAAAAASAVKLNYAAGTQLANASVITGYFNLTGTASTLEPTTITPGNYDVPAVMVTVSKSAGNNGGPIPLMLAKLFNIQSAQMSATAVATAGGPSTIPAGGVFPLVLDQGVVTSLWNASANAPYFSGATPTPISIGGANTTLTLLYIPILTIGNQTVNHGGEFTTFQNSNTSGANVAALILTNNTSPLTSSSGTTTGSTIYISNNYYAVVSNLDVVVPVANNVASGTATAVTINSFAAFHIDQAVSFQGQICVVSVLGVCILAIGQNVALLTGYLSPTGVKAIRGSTGNDYAYGVYKAPQLSQ